MKLVLPKPVDVRRLIRTNTLNESTNVESDESTMSQNAVVSCNRRLLAPAIAGTRLNIHLRSEDFVRIVLRCVIWRYLWVKEP